jgi:hypothetical protein
MSLDVSGKLGEAQSALGRFLHDGEQPHRAPSAAMGDGAQGVVGARLAGSVEFVRMACIEMAA